jgi:cytochrome c553
MKGTLLMSVGILALFAVIEIAHAAGDVEAGKAKAAVCAGCHGANGEGTGAGPALAGWSEDQIVQPLQDYKSGKLVDTVMTSMAAMLSNEDISNIGAYYASLKK